MKDGKQGKYLILMIGMLLVCVFLIAGQPAVPVSAEEGDVDAEVTVTTTSGESYGADVIDSYRVFLSWWSLGVPDNRGAWILYKGWTIIKLESTVTDCEKISIWVAKWGRWSPLFKVYVSSDGSSWQHIGNSKSRSADYTRYDFTGSFQDVKYVKVERTGSGRWSPFFLDAVYAKGGGA